MTGGAGCRDESTMDANVATVWDIMGLVILVLCGLMSLAGVAVTILGIKQKRPKLWIGGIFLFLAPALVLGGLAAAAHLLARVR